MNISSSKQKKVKKYLVHEKLFLEGHCKQLLWVLFDLGLVPFIFIINYLINIKCYWFKLEKF